MIFTEKATFRQIPLLELDGSELLALSQDMKLSLSEEDMVAVQQYYKDTGREPTDVELEVIAQTWSEHCKHRIFSAEITHTSSSGEEVVDSLFKTYIKEPSEEIFEAKPGFVLSAFHDNAGFIKLDDERAICLKVETHNHPSALEPYAGANTGIGGVVRDILGAGLGANPVANVDVFCFGAPDTPQSDIKGDDVIHPLGVMRGVVRGVRDYGNRMGIPTTGGAIQFDPAYIYNPLVYCGTAGVIKIKDIDKQMAKDLKIVALGGRTGRDGLKGATFSSAALDTDSHEEDQTAVQIGNPIEEKKVADCILAARDEGLVTFLTDCGAGGFSSAAGEMLSDVGGEIFLEKCPLKEPGMESWQVFISESQERMVLAVTPDKVERVKELATIYGTEATEIGHSDGTGILRVWHHGELVCELDNNRLHNPPRQLRTSRWTPDAPDNSHAWADEDLGASLDGMLGDFNICSRAPVIREYDHEVQGNTLLKPLAGATGDAPQDGSVIGIDGSDKAMSIALSLLPEWGKYDPYRMGKACVDECIRQLVLTGGDPDQAAILDNFCVGNPDDPEELGALVEACKGIAEAALAYGAPYISGKDSFYNYFQTENGPVSIPTTCLISGIAVVHDRKHTTGSSLRKAGSALCLIGAGSGLMGGSVYARRVGITTAEVPDLDCAAALVRYRLYAQARDAGQILSAHDLSEGGLGVALAEMGFSMKAGIEVDIDQVDTPATATPTQRLFEEQPGRILLEVDPDHVDALRDLFSEDSFKHIGNTTTGTTDLVIRDAAGVELLKADLAKLKATWKGTLAEFY